MGPPAHIPAFLFGNLIASVAYGEHIWTMTPPLVINFTLGIAVTLFSISARTIVHRKRLSGKYNLPLVIPSVLIFILATVVRVDVMFKGRN